MENAKETAVGIAETYWRKRGLSVVWNITMTGERGERKSPLLDYANVRKINLRIFNVDTHKSPCYNQIKA